jgi:hypothetical protein
MCIVESSAYISVLQFEILKGRSFIYKINNNGLKEAFDVVDHDIMARKLEIYGFNEKAFAVFNSYMTNRTQQVQIGNAQDSSSF